MYLNWAWLLLDLAILGTVVGYGPRHFPYLRRWQFYASLAVVLVLAGTACASLADHVAIRRYLIDHQLLFRVRGVYARTPEVLPAPRDAERYMDPIGLT